MRSASTDRRKHRHSLARRVGWANVVAATLGAAVAAAVDSSLASQLLLDEEEARLLRAAERLADETVEEREETLRELSGELVDDGDDDRPARERLEEVSRTGTDPVLELALRDELEDVELPRPRARIDGAGVLLAGDPTLPQPPIGECTSSSSADGAARACSTAFQDGTLVLSMATAASEARATIFGWSAAIGLLVAAVLGGIASLLLTAWGLRPLGNLRKRIALISADSTSPALLEPELEHAELEQVRLALASLVHRLGLALDESRRFSSRVAHELRTPLTTISGELELLTEVTAPAERTALVELQGQVTNLIVLVERLLILGDRTTLGVGQTVDLADVVDGARERLSESDRGRVRTQIADDVLVRGDGPLLRVLVSNALENALKFSSGPVLLRLEAGDAACVVIEDEGPGIAPDELADVREHFRRGRTAMRKGLPGHGVGLALMDHIVRLHRGELRLEARAPRGTRVDIRLPPWRPANASNGRLGAV